VGRASRSRRDAHRTKARELARAAGINKPSAESLRARHDFSFFCYWITRNSSEPATPAEHHKEWHKHWVTEQDSKYLLRIAGDNVDLLAPRGSGKSTSLGLFVAWAIGYHTMHKKLLQILYISYSLSAARGKSKTIRSIIESPEYAEIFPMVAPGLEWSNDNWSIDFKLAGIKSTGAERFTMICAGAAGSITSKRAMLIILDDIIKSAEQIANPSVREKIERNFVSVIRPTLLEGGRIIGLGTRFRPDDIHVTRFNSKKGWIQIEQQAILVDEYGIERSYWESFWSLAYLKQLQKDDPLSFSYQFQNKIVPLDEMGLHPSWIHFEDIPESFDCYAVGIDLASSLKQKADFTVMTLIGKLNDKYYVLDYRRGKWNGNLEKCQQLVELYEEWIEPGIPFTVFCEDTSYQSSFQGDFTNYVVNDLKIYDMQCRGARMKGDKLAHLLSISGIFANGAVAYNRFRFHIEDDMIKELTQFGAMPHDDALDSLVLALQGLGSRRKLLAV